VQRGELWYADLGPEVRDHTVLLLSRDTSAGYRDQVTVAVVTDTIRAIRTHVPVGPEEGLDRDCAVNCDDLNTIPKWALRRRAGVVSTPKLHQVEGAVLVSLAIRCSDHV
jgi:mRNA interferase MazF